MQYTGREGIILVVSMLKRLILQDNIENQKRNYVWNTASGLLNAAEAVVLSMFITRITGLSDSGILAIAFATANLFVTIGKFGVRNYQVSDIQNMFSFSIYCETRFVTIGIMIIVSLLYCLHGIAIKDYSLYKAGSIFCMCMIYVVEALEDVFWGLFQKEGRLYIGGKIFIIRWVGIILTYVLGMLIWKNLLFASILALIVSIVIFGVTIKSSYDSFRTTEIKGTCHKLFIECFPLCMSSFLSYYICNAPKYAIDRYLSDEVQACFGFVAMPVFVINLLSGFIYQPTIGEVAAEWDDEKYSSLQKRTRYQIITIIILLASCTFVAYFWGIPVLSFLYATNLAKYKDELLILLAGGGGLAITNYFVIVLTIMRKQRVVVLVYGAFAFLSMVLSDQAVQYCGTRGVSIVYLGIMYIMALVLYFYICIEFYGHKKKLT